MRPELRDLQFRSYCLGVKLNQYMYNQFVYPDFGKLKITQIKRSDIRRFYNLLVDVRHVKIRTIENIHTVLYQVLNLAVEEEYLRNNPSSNAMKELKQTHNFEMEKRRALTIVYSI